MSMDFDMKQLKRLPNGYKSKVIQTKKVFEKITENFRKSGKTFEENVAWLKSVTDKDGNAVYQNIYAYQSDCAYRVSFDFNLINGEILCDKRTGKYTLWPDCTVFTGSKAGNYGFVDNYKW